MSKIAQFLISNVLVVLWKFIKGWLLKLQRKLRYESDKKKIEQAKNEIKDKTLKYKAIKKIEDVINGKK